MYNLRESRLASSQLIRTMELSSISHSHNEKQQLQELYEPRPSSMVSFTIGRVMNTLLTARPKKLESAISRLTPNSVHSSLESLEDALCFLHKFVKDAAERNEEMDEVLVPMIDNSLKYKDLKHGGQEMIILNWLFHDETVFQRLATNLANIVSRKEDRYIAFGWCTLVRGLIEFETCMDRYLTYGMKERYKALLRIICSCVSHLSLIIRSGSTEQGGFELPSRLSVSAADCCLAITHALTNKVEVLGDERKPSKSNKESQRISLIPSAVGEKNNNPASKFSIADMEMESLLWNQNGELIFLLQKLHAWSRKSRPLHAIGLEQILKWLQGIVRQYVCVQDEVCSPGSEVGQSGLLLLSSCWKHYSKLLHLEDPRSSHNYKESFSEYLSGIQFYTDNYTESGESREGGIETRKFFLNCLCLLLGRLDGKKFEDIVSEFGAQLSHVLLEQLRCDDEDVVEVVVCIFKEVIFKPKFSPDSKLSERRNLDAVIPLLVHLLDERDGTSKAVSMLIAEYCTKTMDEQCVGEVLKRLSSENVLQRRNAVDVISKIIHISSNSENRISHLSWKDITKHLLERLVDEEHTISDHVSSLLPMIDPFLVVPSLVSAIYSTDSTVQSPASNALVGVLKHHNQKTEVICKLLDCLGNHSQIPDLIITKDIKKGSKPENDPVFKLIPDWSKTVRDWNAMSGPLIDKMFAEPSNTVIVRFLSYISEQLGQAADVVLHRVLLKMEEQKELDEISFLKWENKMPQNDDYESLQQYLFDRLCPLLIIRLLPLRVFDLNSSVVYGELLGQAPIHISDLSKYDCVAASLLSRALCKFEFEDVRKLAAELCGRIHPQVLLPVVSSQLQSAVGSRDIPRIKACLFSLCTSYVIRGTEPITNPSTLNIRKKMEKILIWPSLEGDEVSKAQHGCIDCLALMICSEMQAPDTVRNSSIQRQNFGNKDSIEDAAIENSVLTYVIRRLTCTDDIFPSTTGSDNLMFEVPVQISFRLCMANVLISACQKMSQGKRKFAKIVVPYLIHFLKTIEVSDIRAACIQVLFSAVFHLKSAVLPFSSDLCGLALQSLKAGSEKEKIAGAKLVASLMASEDAILGCISGGLLDARNVLSSVSSGDPSPELRQLCKNLLACITP